VHEERGWIVSVSHDRVRPFITIAITCYNAEDTIERAVGSALAQTWPKREILVVDDGSTDQSISLLRNIAQMHREVRVVPHGSNRGVPEARNTLLAEAAGALIAFLDDDDESCPERLERQHRRIVEYESAHPGATVLCYSDRAVVQPGDRHPTSQGLGIGRLAPAPSGSIVADYVLGLFKDDGHHSWGLVGSGTLMARTQALRDLGGFDDRFRRCAELDLAVRAALEGAHFVSVEAPLVTQYFTPSADKAGDADLRYRLLLVEKHRRYLEEKRCYLGARCYMHAWFYGWPHWRWRLWYLAALVCFPWRVSLGRIKRSSLFARLRRSPARRSKIYGSA
jgi:glycosyltransferase involved in cell wall biosynthesis